MSICEKCGKPTTIPKDEFQKWFMQTPPGPFVSLREFLENYCVEADTEVES
jgi:hypothetical protein